MSFTCLKRANPEICKTKKDVLVEMSAITYLDSSGVAALVEGYQLARAAKSGVNQAGLQVLRLARLDRVFPRHGSVCDAVC